jgi:N-acetylglucosamine kinase-like BadF-type ATPase
MKKTLIADSGATKTDWLFVDGQLHKFYRTGGLHPAYLDEKADATDLKVELSDAIPDEVWFFGTGLGNSESDQRMSAFLTTVFPTANIHVKSDLEGSAQAFFGDGDGVVAILGTGSICAKVESGKPVSKSAALGFAIGDEGSAADLGRKILRGYYRNQFSEETNNFLKHNLDPEPYGAMMARIYQSDKPNRELASLAGEVLNESLPEELNLLIKNAFKEFIEQQLAMLDLNGNERIIFTGKVADAHKDNLIDVMKTAGFSDVEVRYPVIESFLERVKSHTIKFW